MKKRCTWVPEDKLDYVEYHDKEWGVPIHNDQKHFELLCLEGAQAGLSWYTILKRRQNYRELFYFFDPNKVSKMTDVELESLIHNDGIIRNRLKIFSVRKNAIAFLKIQEEYGSFDKYIWGYVSGATKLNKPNGMSDIAVTTQESDMISKDLKKRGMSFVGSTIVYAYMQAAGLVNDHMKHCFLCPK